MSKGSSGSVPFSVKMKAVGRGVARAQQQAASAKSPMGKYSGGTNTGSGSSGTMGEQPKDVASRDPSKGKGYGGMATASGGGTVRGTGAQTKGKTWQGTF